MPFRPAHFLSFLFVFISFFSSAQDVELITRYSYYTHESEATLIIFGKDVEQVSQIKDENGQNIPVVQNNADSRLATVSLEKMDVGTKLLTFQIYLQNGTTTKQSVEIIRLAPKPNEVKVDRLTGGLLVNDLPFFPFGFYTGSPVGDILIQEAYNAMNLVGVYQKNDEESLEDRKAYMDQCAALGIKVNYHVNGLVGKPHNNTGFLITEEEEKHREQMLRREIELFKDHPALLSWYMNDEPIGQGRPPELLETAYQMIKEIDPYHPVSVVFVVPSKADAFANTMDIAMTDPYPIPGDVSNVRDAMQQLQKHFKYKKAFWMVPQAFGGGEFWPREPTAAEIRAMTYLGIYEGAMGVKYFIRRQPNFFPKSRLAWNECTKMAHELSMMTPWLFSEKGKTILQTNNKNILAAAWKKGNSTIILAVNTKNQPAPFSLNLENIEFPGNGNLRLLFENRSIEVENSGFQDIIDGHGTRVYLLETPPNEKDAGLQKHNLFINPGFEICASPGVPQGCYAGSDQQPIYDGSTYFVDSRMAYEGNNSLRFNNVSESSHTSLSFYRMLVGKGRLYQCSLWSRSAKNTDSIAFSIGIPALDINHTFYAKPLWREHTFYMPVNKDVNSVSLQVQTKGKGTFWIDQIAVFPDPLIDVQVSEKPEAIVNLLSLNPDTDIWYSIEEEGTFLPYEKPFLVNNFTNVQLSLRKKETHSQSMSFVIPLSKATFKNCKFETLYNPKYKAQGDQSILNGKYGTLAFKDNNWLGFDGKDVEFTVDMGKVVSLEKATAHFLVSVKDGIHAPLAMEVSLSKDGKSFKSFGRAENLKGSEHKAAYYYELKVVGKKQKVRFVKFKIKSPVTIPPGFLFSDTNAWIFLDEVLID